MTDHLQVLLRKAGYHLHTTAEKEIVRMIKEKTCYVALSPSKEEKESHSGGSARIEEFRLPDGNIIRVSKVALFAVHSLMYLLSVTQKYSWERSGIGLQNSCLHRNWLEWNMQVCIKW